MSNVFILLRCPRAAGTSFNLSYGEGGSSGEACRISEGVLRRMRIRVLTFNVGLMRLRLGGVTVFENPAGVGRRAPMIVRRLRDVCLRENPDIVCLQECYEQEHRDAVKVALRPEYPYMATSHYHTWMNSGLMTFCKHPHPVLSFRRVPHTVECLYERVFGDRAMLVTRVAYRGTRPLTVVNAHLSSGCPVEGDEIAAIRHRQIRDIDRAVESTDCPGPVIVAGDFNCSTKVTPQNYRGMERLGWVDAWPAANGGGVPETPTWDKANPLNADKPSLQGRSHRCDHIWVARRSGALSVHECRVIAERDPVSDHYAVIADVEITPTPSVPPDWG